MLHGIRVLKQVVLPWFGTNRIVCADSYFASSVGAAKELFRNGRRFIGVINTARGREMSLRRVLIRD